jgi:thiamine-monophosphate kinase
MHTPVPRVALGLLLAEQGIAHAAIDISDGLVGDLGHILKRSAVGATLDVDALPAGLVLATQDTALRRAYGAAGGDDYELCFTAPAARARHPGGGRQRRHARSRGSACIEARIRPAPGRRQGQPLDLKLDSFDHFTS